MKNIRENVGEILDLQLPSSKKEIAQIQSAQKKVALTQAKKAKFYQGRLDHVDPDNLDDPVEWARIPIIDKEKLRELGVENFSELFCIAEQKDIAEYWRSGGATGVPLYYPRTYTDMYYTYIQLCRCWTVAGLNEDDICHQSFPYGVHPAGQLWSRTANQVGIGVLWAGSGANTPSRIQLELIEDLQPTIWMGMPSYGLHLANLAGEMDIDLAGGNVRKVIVGAEALSAAKREKLERAWGAEVNDFFGMTEIGILGADSKVHEGFHIWTDQALFEVVDEETGLPVPEGEEGLMVITPLFCNTSTPFLRWSSGDIVRISNETSLEGPFSIFPVMRHANRTVGFAKIRGININHSEFEDFMFRVPEINDFKVEFTATDGLDNLVVSTEVDRKSDAKKIAETLAENIRDVFEVRPVIEILETGTLAKEFEASVKAPRFVDKRA
ncbi:MAG: AMP-binding protein [Rhodospirillales bacterium]|nr:AMP-binding protein [Rhodospirillales bacterium]